MTQVGLTSYVTLPFVSSVYQQSWASSPSLYPANLFWAQGQNFNNATTMANAKADAAAKTAAGIVPAAGCQRWDTTFLASLPAIAGESSDVANDRKTLQSSGEYVALTAWAAWIKARPSYMIINADGSSPSVASSPQLGHISPLMPLTEADWPSGIGAVYGDLFAQQWGQSAGKSGAYGIMLSDYTDSQPIGASFETGFNPEIIAAFSARINQPIPGATVAAMSAYIKSNLFLSWTDFLCNGYARFYGALAAQISAGTGESALVIDQGSLAPSQRRLYGTDQRLIANGMSPDNYICVWDNQTFQVGRSGQPMIWSLGGAVLASAREPNIRNGANLECDTPAFAAACAVFYSDLDASDQRERGLKDIKRNWLENAFSHIADRSGSVRRALGCMSRDYWDGGALDPVIAGLIQSIVPTKPCGPAIYYSTACEAIAELAAAKSGSISDCYMTPDKIVTYKNAGGTANYYVSDAALGAMTAASKPSAWVIIDGTLSSAEKTALIKKFPAIPTLIGNATSPALPIVYSKGLTGFAFYDQNGRLIVTVTNTTAATVNGTVNIKPMTDAYTALDLIGGTSQSLTKPQMSVSITRWDTLIFAITPA